MLDLPARRTRRNGPARSDVNWGRLRRRCRPRVCLFEDRTLLSAPSADPLAAVAIPIALGTPKTGTLSANEVVFFQISPTTDGRLIAQLHAPGGATRLTLMDSQGQVLLTSDGQSPTNQDDQIELYVPAGTDFLEVQNLEGSGTYVLTTSLTPSAPPLQPIPINPDGSEPVALVTGDFTGDGRTDLAVANQESNDVSILMGNGDGTFQHSVSYAVGDFPVAIVAGDFTGDGHTDLAVANSGSNDVSILLGNGTFQNQVTYAVGWYPVALVTGDFTGDGRTDLAVANSGSNDVSILLGNGDGTFQPQVTYAVGAGPDAIVTGDFNGDGHTDLAVANSGSNDVSILLGNGDGTFQNQVTYEVGSAPRAIVTGDFTGDGHPGLAVANQSSNDVSVLLGNGDGTFAAPGQFATTPHATPLVADVNGDGTDDVLVVDGAGNILYRQGIPGQPGTFEPPVTINPGNPSRDIAWVPDTNQGPVLASVDAHDNAISLYAYRDGGFVKVGSLATGFLPAQIIAADLNGDGWTDLVGPQRRRWHRCTAAPSVFFANTFTGLINPQADFQTFLPPVTLPVGLGVSDVQAVDTTGSGRLDLVVTNKLSGQVSVIRNLGDGSFAAPVPYRAGTGLSAIDPGSTPEVTSLEATAGVAAGPLTPGGPTSLVTINPGSNTLDVLAGLGGGRFANPVTIQTASPAQVVRMGDFTGNGIDDLAVLTTSGVSIYLGNGKGGFLLSHHLPGRPRVRRVDPRRSDGKRQTRPLGRRCLWRCPGAAGQRRWNLPALPRG